MAFNVVQRLGRPNGTTLEPDRPRARMMMARACIHINRSGGGSGGDDGDAAKRQRTAKFELCHFQPPPPLLSRGSGDESHLCVTSRARPRLERCSRFSPRRPTPREAAADATIHLATVSSRSSSTQAVARRAVLERRCAGRTSDGTGPLKKLYI